MTYAILKEGVFHLFEAQQEAVYKCGVYCGDRACRKCEETKNNYILSFCRSVDSAIVAEDQEHVKNLVDLKILSRGKQDFYPLPGYRIEVKEVQFCKKCDGRINIIDYDDDECINGLDNCEEQMIKIAKLVPNGSKQS